jgi:D-serine deaminase-like pyridoxal phosphate-dependent protein
LVLDGLLDYEAVLHNEEHLVIETPHAAGVPVGAEFLAIPTHICPTCAMHQQAYVIDQGRMIGTWDIAARDRILR